MAKSMPFIAYIWLLSLLPYLLGQKSLLLAHTVLKAQDVSSKVVLHEQGGNELVFFLKNIDTDEHTNDDALLFEEVALFDAEDVFCLDTDFCKNSAYQFVTWLKSALFQHKLHYTNTTIDYSSIKYFVLYCCFKLHCPLLDGL